MLTWFYLAESAWQIVLLVISQLVVISLASVFILLFIRKCNAAKLAVTGGVLLLNMVGYVLMQLDSRITGWAQGTHLHIPYGVLLLAELLSLGFCLWSMLSETKNRKTINNSSIKEAFDNLPTGVCFFNENGLPVLCNYAMQSFGFAVCGRDIQFISDLEDCLAEGFVSGTEAKKEGKLFVLPDGRAQRLEKRVFEYEGNEYTQFVATDVTDLNKNRVELDEENAQLRRVQADLKSLSANVVAATREEEIFNTKMRVHDEMGKCLVAAQRYLHQDNAEDIPDSLASSWSRAVSMIKYNNDTPEENMLLQIRKTCEYMKIAFIQSGELPAQENLAYLLTCAVRECVTNAVRYAQAGELYAQFTETGNEVSVTVTNDGVVPEHEIVEGGGLSTLRRRIERAGGTMSVQSFPKFKLTVTVPKGREGVL